MVLALRRARAAPPARTVDAACARAVAWTVGMQSRDGGWGAFDADNDSRLVAALPFCDFGEVTDPPSADVTAHVHRDARRRAGRPARRAARGAWPGCRTSRRPDGSWFGRWGVNYVYGTGAAVPALVRPGWRRDDPRIRRAVTWLESHQNPDGGWGEDLRSYVDRGLARAGAPPRRRRRPGPCWPCWPPASGDRAATRRGVEWLVDTQRPDGTWDEPWFTGTGFPWDFSINYHLYRLVWPVMALGRYVRGREPGSRRP